MTLNPHSARSFLSLDIAAATVFLFTAAPAAADAWPIGSWRLVAPESRGIRSRPIVEMPQAIRKNAYPLRSITIVCNGLLVLETYCHPFKAQETHRLYSIAKKITAALIGIATRNVSTSVAINFNTLKRPHLSSTAWFLRTEPQLKLKCRSS